MIKQKLINLCKKFNIKKEKKIYISKSEKLLDISISILSQQIRVYDFKEISIDNGYIGIDSLQLSEFLTFYMKYSQALVDEFFIEIKNIKYSFDSLDIKSIYELLDKVNSFYIIVVTGREIYSKEILIGDIKDDFLLFRSNNISYKKQKLVDIQEFGYIYLRDINNQYLPSMFHFEEPIDIVYTWVNSADEEWQKLFSSFKDISELNQDRYMSIDELKYSLRSIQQYARWVNKIYIVTNCQKPKWLKEHPKIEWITHEMIFQKDELPTFNSHALGLTIYKIPNLSEHFIYFNDDVFLSNRVKKEDFFTPNNLSVSYLEPYGIIYHNRANYAKEGYVFSALNGKKLFEKKYNFSPTQLHRHVPLAFKKSILIKMEKEFKKEIKNTRKNRFRDQSDVSVSFLYNHYALYHKEAVYRATNSILISYRNYKKSERNILKRQPKFFCINDGGGSTQIKEYKEWEIKFLEKLFPKKAEWEE